MRFWLIALIAALAAWFGLKDRAYGAFQASGEPSVPPALIYTEADSWAALPQPLPNGAWETPWGIDAFVVLPPARVARRHGLLDLGDLAVVNAGLRDLARIGAAIPGETPVYAPLYRAPSPANKDDVAVQMNALAQTDLMSAFEHYLAEYNQGRGIILVTAEPAGDYVDALIERLQADDLVTRFAGMVNFAQPGDIDRALALNCTDVLEGACYQQVETFGATGLAGRLLPSLPDARAPIKIVDARGIAEAIRVQAENVSTWLDETQPKPAEPFFAVEVVREAPVFRPGADEPIDVEDGN